MQFRIYILTYEGKPLRSSNSMEYFSFWTRTGAKRKLAEWKGFGAGEQLYLGWKKMFKIDDIKITMSRFEV